MSASDPARAAAIPSAGRRPRRASAEGALVVGVQIAIVLVVLLVWQGAVVFKLATEFFFGRPDKMFVWLYANTLNGYLLVHTWTTLYAQLVGFAIGTIGGTAAGLALWWSPYLSRVLDPFAVVFNATPKIVIAPVLIVWFGIGVLSKVMIAVLVCGIVAWLGAFDGTKSADPDQMDMVRALGGRKRHVFFKIVVPHSLPWIITTMRINIGLALIGVITGEFLSSTQGLGYLVDRSAKLYEMSQTMAGLFMLAVIAAAQLYAVNWLERRLLHWSAEQDIEISAQS